MSVNVFRIARKAESQVIGAPNWDTTAHEALNHLAASWSLKEIQGVGSYKCAPMQSPNGRLSKLRPRFGQPK